MRIELVIERLTLDGFDMTPPERARLEASMRREFAALLSVTREAPGAAGLALPSIAAAPLAAGDLVSAERLGVGLARSVHAGLASAGIAAPAEPKGGRG